MEIESLIVDNGGKVVDLSDPKLTHVVLDKRDTSRRKELMRLTSKYRHVHMTSRRESTDNTVFRPKRRNLVISDFIHACLEEDTLLDEESE